MYKQYSEDQHLLLQPSKKETRLNNEILLKMHHCLHVTACIAHQVSCKALSCSLLCELLKPSLG